jgi:glycine oxidase
MCVDFIIVGQGIAGTCFAFELIRQNKTFIIVDNYVSNSSSQVALGVYNPIILKWFTKPWKVDQQINLFYSFYDELNLLLNKDLYNDSGIYKFLHTAGDQNNWLVKSKSIHRSKYMSSKLFKLDNINLTNSKFYGYVNQAGKLNVQNLLKLFRQYCLSKNILKEEKFIYKDLHISKSNIKYKNINAKKIIFCEGSSIVRNPYFKNLNFKLNKGEILTILSKDLHVNTIMHSGLLLVPLNNNLYKIGATYSSDFIHNNPTKSAKEILKSYLNKILKCPYEIVDHQSGIRPSTEDRRPLIGSHVEHSNMYIMNGLGTRGVLLAPYLSGCLLDNIFCNKKIDNDININRINKKAP